MVDSTLTGDAANTGTGKGGQLAARLNAIVRPTNDGYTAHYIGVENVQLEIEGVFAGSTVTPKGQKFVIS